MKEQHDKTISRKRYYNNENWSDRLLTKPKVFLYDNYTIVITSFSLYELSKEDPNFELNPKKYSVYASSGSRSPIEIAGKSRQYENMVVSTNSFKNLDEIDHYNSIKIETMYQLGKMLGLVPENREKHTRRDNHDHLLCTNNCIMGAAIERPDSIASVGKYVLYDPLCPDCISDLNRLFRSS
jgi:hypothetical protein